MIIHRIRQARADVVHLNDVPHKMPTQQAAAADTAHRERLADNTCGVPVTGISMLPLLSMPGCPSRTASLLLQVRDGALSTFT